MKKILGWILAGLFLLGMACLTIPDIYRRRFVNVLVCADASTRRRTETTGNSCGRGSTTA